jgi:hypothetical protein
MANFNDDLAKGRMAEHKFQFLLQSDYPRIKIENSESRGEFADWDISTTAFTQSSTTIRTFEIKHNRKYDSGNVCIETGKVVDGYLRPSGLSATKADYYCFNFENENDFYVIKTDQLREYIQTNNIKHKYHNNYQLIFFPRQFLIQQSYKLTPRN